MTVLGNDSTPSGRRRLMELRPGSVIVFEGLDRTGKSTQVQRLRNLTWGANQPVFAHMPSGLTRLTQEIYGITEQVRINSGVARQLLHLACHAENMTALNEGASGGLVLDRWWWSTMAYGWYGGAFPDAGMRREVLQELIDAIWRPVHADIVLLFLHPYGPDAWNRDAVKHGYQELAQQDQERTVFIPPGTQEETSDLIVDRLLGAGILTR